jgi:hypothetical protein
MLREEISKNGYNCDLNHIDTNEITDMSYLFAMDDHHAYKLYKFNGDISSWTIDGSFCDYHLMFVGCKYFEQKHYPSLNHQ